MDATFWSKKNFFPSSDGSPLCLSVGPTFNADGPHYHFDIFSRNASIVAVRNGGEETNALWIAIIEVAVVE